MPLEQSPPHLGVQGRPRKIYKEVEEGIRNFLDKYPTALQDKISDFLWDEYDIAYSILIVSRVLKKIRITYKVASRVHTEQDTSLRTTYLLEIARSYFAE
jgi:transposase